MNNLIKYNMDNFLDLISVNFQDCVWLAVMLMAMIPTIESKIAIPFGMNTEIWGAGALTGYESFLFAFLGSILPSFFIILIVRKLKSKIAGFMTNKFLQKYYNKSRAVNQAKNNFTKYFMLTGFVAVPLPLTGVWTGSLIVGLSNLDIRYGFLSIVIGAMISAGMITLICEVFSNSITYILIISLIIILLFLFTDLFITIFKELKEKRKDKKRK